MEFDLDLLGGPRALDALVSEVLAAGEAALTLQRQGVGDRAARKADRSPVTEADTSTERRLRAFIEARFPGAAYVGEETGAKDGSSLRFIVDPIDGTRAFLRGLPTWSVLVGVEHEGEPVVGVAFIPGAGDLFVGALGHGARVNGRPATLSLVDSLDNAMVAHGGLGQFAEANYEEALGTLARGTFTQRGLSDFANYGELLRGKVDAVVDPGISPWDVAPAAVLIREAGGRFTDLAGRETIHGDGALASNGAIHEALLGLLPER